MTASSLPKPQRLCTIEGCERPYYGRGWCTVHYDRWRHHGYPERLKKVPLADRFWAKVNKDGPTMPHMDTPCWEWTAATASDGYGSIAIDNRRIGAHCVGFYLHHGRWAVPMCLHHCDNRKCVNPDHLYEGTSSDNARDAYARHRRPLPQPREVCRKGHPLTKVSGTLNRAFYEAVIQSEWVRSLFAHVSVNQVTAHVVKNWVDMQGRARSPVELRPDFFEIRPDEQ